MLTVDDMLEQAVTGIGILDLTISQKSSKTKQSSVHLKYAIDVKVRYVVHSSMHLYTHFIV